MSKATAIIKVLPIPLLIVFGQAMVKLWPISPPHVIVLSIFVIAFVAAARYMADEYDRVRKRYPQYDIDSEVRY
jgi:hypothetical protein